MELIFNPCGEFRRGPEGPLNQINSNHLQVCAPGIFSNLLRSVQRLKREWGAESNGKLPHLFNPGKTAALVPEFAVEGFPSAETAVLVSAPCSEGPDLGQNTLMMMVMMIMMILTWSSHPYRALPVWLPLFTYSPFSVSIIFLAPFSLYVHPFYFLSSKSYFNWSMFNLFLSLHIIFISSYFLY